MTLADVWYEVVGTQVAPPDWLVLATGVLAVIVVAWQPVWRPVRGVVTIAHEGGHAVAALLSGRTLQGVRLHSDTSGVTVSRGKPTGPGMVITMLAGYLAPSLLGLGAVGLLATDHITALLWISILLLAVMLLLIRNAYGVFSVVGTGAIIFILSWFASAEVQAGFAYLFTWFLLVSAPRPVFELQAKRRRHRAPDSDADQLARLTGLGAGLWVGIFGLVTVAALALGVYWLVPWEALSSLQLGDVGAGAAPLPAAGTTG